MHIIRIKNWIKCRLNPQGKIYAILQKAYGSLVFPFERRLQMEFFGRGFNHSANLAMCSLLPRKTVDEVVRTYQPKSWLDVGCGTGAALKYVRDIGIEIKGLEYSELAIRESGLPYDIQRADLTVPVRLGRSFDLVWCYEVAEHLPESAADTLVDTLCHHSQIVVLSAATPGQGGEGHINEQPIEYWAAKMKRKGFLVDQAATDRIRELRELFSGNLVCYVSE